MRASSPGVPWTKDRTGEGGAMSRMFPLEGASCGEGFRASGTGARRSPARRGRWSGAILLFLAVSGCDRPAVEEPAAAAPEPEVLPTFTPHPATQDPSVRVDIEQLERWADELSNWGRWGADDQRGTLNLITPEKTREAAGLVRDGRTVSLQHFVVMEKVLDSWTRGEADHWMVFVDPETGQVTSALDAVTIPLHDRTLSHFDALCHWATDREEGLRAATRDPERRIIYNGFPQNLTVDGCVDGAVDRMGPGYVTRAILVDLPLLRGVDWLEPTTPVLVSDLEEWERYAGVRVGPGDALLVRTGRWAKRAAEGPWAHHLGGSGLHASVLPWLKERGVALLVGDALNDVKPSGVEGFDWPIHQIGLVNLGLPLVDNGYLEDAAGIAAELGRWEFMLSWQILAIPGGTGSPFNATATF